MQDKQNFINNLSFPLKKFIPLLVVQDEIWSEPPKVISS